MSFSLALSGGAARGAFHLGFLHYIEENRLDISVYSGSSIGAIIAVSHASGVSAKEQLDIFNSNTIKKALRFNYLKGGLLKVDSTHAVFDKLLPIRRLEELSKPVFVNAYDIKKRKLHYFSHGDTHALCMASSALVPLFKPVAYKHMSLIDGGLVDNVPVKPLLDFEYDIVSVDLLPGHGGILRKKFFAHWYRYVEFAKQNSDLYISTPKLKKLRMFTFSNLEEGFDMGYKEAKRAFENPLHVRAQTL